MMKYTLALILWPHDSNTEGEYPVYLRIRIDGKVSYISTGHHVPKRFWDDKHQTVKDSYLKAGVINAEIHDLRAKVQGTLVKIKLAGQQTTAREIKAQFHGGTDQHNIFDFIDQYIIDMAGKRAENTLETYRRFSRTLLLFHKGRTLTFEQITTDYIQRFETWFRAPDEKGKAVSGNYVWASFKALKTFFNAARKRGIITAYPFAKYENPKYVDGDKDYLTLAELDRFEAHADTLTDRVDRQAAVYFLHGCYCGLRVSDWFQFNYSKHVVNGQIRLRASKNGGWVSMPITSRLKRNLARVKALPLDIEEHSINRSIQAIAKKLKLKKHLTSHCARKTFAITICSDRGIGAEVCANLMGITIQVCIKNYYRVTSTKINQECLKAWNDL